MPGWQQLLATEVRLTFAGKETNGDQDGTCVTKLSILRFGDKGVCCYSWILVLLCCMHLHGVCRGPEPGVCLLTGCVRRPSLLSFAQKCTTGKTRVCEEYASCSG